MQSRVVLYNDIETADLLLYLPLHLPAISHFTLTKENVIILDINAFTELKTSLPERVARPNGPAGRGDYTIEELRNS